MKGSDVSMYEKVTLSSMMVSLVHTRGKLSMCRTAVNVSDRRPRVRACNHACYQYRPLCGRCSLADASGSRRSRLSLAAVPLVAGCARMSGGFVILVFHSLFSEAIVEISSVVEQ